jgi:hypothetical protein
MATPSTIFASLPELLRCVADHVCLPSPPCPYAVVLTRLTLQIHRRQQLTELCLVNKIFNAAITPFLYREFTIPRYLSKAALNAACLAIKSHRRHIRGVSITSPSIPSADGSCQDILDRILPDMPRLESFTQVTNTPRH